MPKRKPEERAPLPPMDTKLRHQLAHVVRDPNGRAYNRTAHLEARRKMMQTWADYLDGLKG